MELLRLRFFDFLLDVSGWFPEDPLWPELEESLPESLEALLVLSFSSLAVSVFCCGLGVRSVLLDLLNRLSRTVSSFLS